MKTLKILVPAFFLTALLAMPVAHGDTILATQDGPLMDSATWGGVPLPLEGDTSTWDANGFWLSTPGSWEGTFHGGHLLLSDGSELRLGVGGNGNLQATTFDNAILRKGSNIPSILNFSGQELTFASGGAFFVSSAQNRNITLDNAVWAGSGPITFRGLVPTNEGAASVLFLGPGNTLSGYTGVIWLEDFTNEARPIRLTIEAETTGSFGVRAGPGTQLDLRGAAEFTFSVLVLGGEPVAAGTYEYSDFTPAQQAFLLPGPNPGQVEVLTEPVPLPRLAIRRENGDQVRISWPSDSPGDWILQSSAGLDSGFEDAELEITVEDDENAAYDTTTEPRQFYRLVPSDPDTVIL